MRTSCSHKGVSYTWLKLKEWWTWRFARSAHDTFEFRYPIPTNWGLEAHPHIFTLVERVAAGMIYCNLEESRNGLSSRTSLSELMTFKLNDTGLGPEIADMTLGSVFSCLFILMFSLPGRQNWGIYWYSSRNRKKCCCVYFNKDVKGSLVKESLSRWTASSINFTS